MDYLFILGKAPSLAKAEIESVLSSANWSYTRTFSNDLVMMINSEPLDSRLFDQLGGTVKVAEVFAKIESSEFDLLSQRILNEIKSFASRNSQKSVDFGLSFLGKVNLSQNFMLVNKIIKAGLQKEGFKARFVLTKPGDDQISSVVVRKQHLVEIVITQGAQTIFLGRTIWVQDFEDWGKRDYGRPEAEGHIGMLPPKVARMMVNLAKPGLIVDPFCGVGTILAEALILGNDVIGLDINSKQVSRSLANLKWLEEIYAVKKNYKIFAGDAREITKFLNGQKVSSIVTEPDLGPNINQVIPPKILHNLENLYTNCLDRWQTVLLPGGRVVIAVPSFLSNPNSPSEFLNEALVKAVVDKAKIMGYSLLIGPLSYSRPQARVRRNICVFER